MLFVKCLGISSPHPDISHIGMCGRVFSPQTILHSLIKWEECYSVLWAHSGSCPQVPPNMASIN